MGSGIFDAVWPLAKVWGLGRVPITSAACIRQQFPGRWVEGCIFLRAYVPSLEGSNPEVMVAIADPREDALWGLLPCGPPDLGIVTQQIRSVASAVVRVRVFVRGGSKVLLVAFKFGSLGCRFVGV